MEPKPEKKKSGYGLFIFLFILFALFIFFLPDINEIIHGDYSSLSFLNNKNTNKTDDTSKDTSDETEKATEATLTCTLTKDENNIVDAATIKLTSVDNELTKTVESHTFTASASTDLDSIKTTIETIGLKFQDYSGFTFSTSSNDTTYTVSNTIDFSMIDKTKWEVEDNEDISKYFHLDYEYKQSITDIKANLTEEEYSCK